jgi:multidrug efflux pump subunit AcrA (membrane-fusion protein)
MSTRPILRDFAFEHDLVRVEQQRPAPLARMTLYLVLALVALLVGRASFGKLDIVAVSRGKLVPQSFLKILQPAEAGIVREILVGEGEAVKEGQVLVRMDARLSDADARMIWDGLQRSLQLRRIDAELTGATLRVVGDDPRELVAQVNAQLQARRQAHLDALGAEQALRARRARARSRERDRIKARANRADLPRTGAGLAATREGRLRGEAPRARAPEELKRSRAGAESAGPQYRIPARDDHAGGQAHRAAPLELPAAASQRARRSRSAYHKLQQE